MTAHSPDFDAILAHGAIHRYAGGESAVIRVLTDATLTLTSGHVTFDDPTDPLPSYLCPLRRGLLPETPPVPPGQYPVHLIVADITDAGGGPDVTSKVAAVRLVVRDEPAVAWDIHNDYPDGQLVRAGGQHGFPSDPAQDAMVMFPAGWTRGYYRTWAGRGADGGLVCLLTDFEVLPEDVGDRPAARPSVRPSVRDEGIVVLEAVDGLSPGAGMVEPFGGGTGFRFKVRNVRIDGLGDTVHVRGGGSHQLSFDVLHDCPECGNAVNQVIVGLAGQDRAQASVWNGKQRSGGGLKVVNPGTGVAAMAEDNPGPAEWVNVSCDIVVPDKPGTYSVRARYAQAYQGRLMTSEGRVIPQPEYEDVLGWWKVDRPDGPGPESTMGTIIVEP